MSLPFVYSFFLLLLLFYMILTDYNLALQVKVSAMAPIACSSLNIRDAIFLLSTLLKLIITC